MSETNPPTQPRSTQQRACKSQLPDEPKNFVQVLAEELAEIQRLRDKRGWQEPAKSSSGQQPPTSLPCTPPKDPKADPDGTFAAAHDSELVGLAFSGGGIRSATFNLGVLQALADLDLLRRFDYLSTVSGGGYIGSWLAAWIGRRGFEKVNKGLRSDRKPNEFHKEPDEIRFLRDYSNYLTPKMGFFGADTWTAIAIYLRNTLLNQAVLVLALSAVLLTPRVMMWLTQLAALHPACLRGRSYVVSLFFLAVAILFAALNFCWLARPDSSRRPPWYTRQGPIVGVIVVPLLLAGWSGAVWLWFHPWGLEHFDRFLVFGAVIYAVMWLGAAITLPPEKEKALPWGRRHPSISAVFWAIFAGGAGGGLFWVLAKIFAAWKCWPGNIWHMISFGPPLAVVALLLVAALHIGLMERSFPDERREWCGRLGGWLLILALGWVAIFAIAIYSPLGVIRLKGWVKGVSLAWVLSTLAGIVGGKSPKTGGADSKKSLELALSITPYIFAIGALVALAFGLELALAKTIASGDVSAELQAFLCANPAITKIGQWLWIVPDRLALWFYHDALRSGVGLIAVSRFDYKTAHWCLLAATQTPCLIILPFVLAGLAWLLAWRVDINEFSMHLLYRNRLVRCYLGASHAERKPNPFTGFDANDDVFLRCLRAKESYEGPFPIINAALNLVAGKELAWQERKAESFVMTPLHCGFDVWIEHRRLEEEYTNSKNERGIWKYGFRPTECYAYADGGFYLGTAMGISGAAASPNMGYHSTPSLAFLMTLFNVRLGYWAGNPRQPRTWQKPGSRFGLAYLLAELFGQTDDESGYVYLSDGGHFENLGLYELVKRRCKYVLVCDAGADEEFGFGDLAGAIRKCREDMGVEIRLKTDQMLPQGTDKRSIWHCAVGEIHYENVDYSASPDDPGILIYLKPSLTGDEPADVLNYKSEHPHFPHETTIDQFFSESQFESYRRLGQHGACTLFEKVWNWTPCGGKIEDGQKQLKDCCTRQLFGTLKDKWPSCLGPC